MTSIRLTSLFEPVGSTGNSGSRFTVAHLMSYRMSADSEIPVGVVLHQGKD